MADKNIFKKGEVVPKDGKYVCVPCGFRKEYKRGDIFKDCIACLSDISSEDKKLIKNTGLWELVSSE